VRILHRRRLAEVPADQVPELERELAAEHDQISGGLDRAVELGVIDEVIAPDETRSAIAAALGAALTGVPARGRHGNIPL
jgi:acetyl-CoA/propionyl-CoA carboxylase carboxyl transferase subunit